VCSRALSAASAAPRLQEQLPFLLAQGFFHCFERMAWSARRNIGFLEQQRHLRSSSYRCIRYRIHAWKQGPHKNSRPRHGNLRRGYAVQVSAKIVIDLVLAIECPDAKSRLRALYVKTYCPATQISDRTGTCGSIIHCNPRCDQERPMNIFDAARLRIRHECRAILRDRDGQRPFICEGAFFGTSMISPAVPAVEFHDARTCGIGNI